GMGVARGYLKRPALTVERFVADPYGKPGSRMYRTGDLACRRVNGILEFAGRADHQIKILGYRIEPGEIESLLKRHDRLADAVVIFRVHAGDKQLAGYVIACQDEAEQSQEQASQITHWQQLYESTYR